MSKKALLLGSSYSALPILATLKKHGLSVSVCGNRKDDPCHEYGDGSFYVDYSKRLDLEGVFQTEKFDYVVPSCNDYSYLTGAYIANKYSVPGYDGPAATRVLHSKADYRQKLSEIGLPSPKFRKVGDPKSANFSDLSFPILIKPVDSFSGRGISKVVSSEGVTEAIYRALRESRTQEAIVEEFREGSLHSHSAFIRDKSIAFDFFADEFCTVYPYQVNCSNSPSVLSASIKQKIREAIGALVGSLGIVDGLLHTQFIASSESVFLIESMRRCPGDLFDRMISLSTSFDYLENYVRPFIAMPLAEPTVIESRFIGRHTISSANPTSFFGFANRTPAKSIDFVPLKESGERLDVAPYDKAGILFAEFEDAAAMRAVAPNFADYIEILTCQLATRPSA